MASISTAPNGVRTLQFVDTEHKRRSVRLGKVSLKIAQAIKLRAEHILSAKKLGEPVDSSVLKWLQHDVSDELAAKLAAVGLIEDRMQLMLGQFLETLIESRQDLTPNSLRNFNNTRYALIKYFGAERDLRTIKPGECDEWRQSLVNDKYATATISQHVKFARGFFKRAVRKGLIQANPLADVKMGSQANEERTVFVDRATIDRAIAACPNDEWRLIIALSRYGGLRCPSEVLNLKLSDINWEHNRIKVDSPKTEHLGKPFRIMPLFPELRPYLEQVFNNAPEGQVYFIHKYRDVVNQNLRTHFMRILAQAGVSPWRDCFTI